jgi:RNA methyltransferase, TrmH family
VEAGRFVIEGPVLVQDALAAGVAIGPVFAEHSMFDRVPSGVELVVCEDGALAKVLDSVSPQPIACTAPLLTVALGTIVDATFVMVCDQVADPGNLGTIIRAAEAAGADALVVTAGTVDVHSPKVVRSTAGALFHIPIVEASLAELASLGSLQLIATSSHATVSYDGIDFTQRVAIVVGNEAHGLDDAAIRLCPEQISIPHAGRSESLNVAMAASIVAFEVLRQRRDGSNRP